MRLPRDLSGPDLVEVLRRSWGYRRVHQEGSHIVLETDAPSHQRIVLPAHRVLRLGTLNSIVRAVASHKQGEAGDRRGLASGRLPALLAVEIPTARRQTENCL